MTLPSERPATMVLEGPIAELRDRLIRLLGEVAEFVGKQGADGLADRGRLRDAADDLREMFLLVAVIGEFNAGKSTFINALLGEAILPSGITPTTDMIELVRYAPQATPPVIRAGSAIREWGHPNTGGAGIAIVDTPGTGSVFAKHEEIAKSFLHRSDLVIFIISAKRAFAETERMYLELAKNYGKKIVVVINQIDLLNPQEQGEVRKFVQQQIDQMLDLRPPIFMVSAKRALQNPTLGGLLSGLAAAAAPSDSDETGMKALAAHLREVFEQVPPAKQKLITRLELLRAVMARHAEALNARLALIGADTDAAEALQREIDGQAGNLEKQLNKTLEEMRGILNTVLQRGEKFIESNIKVLQATFRGVDREAMAAAFDKEVIGDSMTRLASAQEGYVNALVDGGRAYWRGVIDRLAKMEALLREEATGMDAAAYAEQRAALQTALTVANVEMKAYTDSKVIEAIEDDYDQNVRNFIYGAVGGVSGLAAFILSAAAAAAPGVLPPLAAIGIVAGPLLAVVGGGYAVTRWRKAVRDARVQLKDRLDALEANYRNALTKLTVDERNRLIQYGKQILAPVFSQLSALAGRYKDQQTALTNFTERINEIDRSLGNLG